MRRETFTVSGPVALVVRAPAGAVEIEAAEVSEAIVELEALRDGAESAVEGATVELRGGSEHPELLVDIQHGLRFGGHRGPKVSIFLGRGPSIRVGVRVPVGSSVEVVTDAADVAGTGMFRRADVKSAAGNVRFDDIDGDVSIKCVSGDVTIGSVGGETNVKSVSGDATIGRVVGPAALHSVSGDIEVREGDASISVNTISGDVRIGSAAQGEVALHSVSGDLTLGLRSGSKLWVDARSTSGKTTSEFALGDEPSSNGGPLVELRAKSVSGDIRVVRA
jgi:hypothetical protein